MPGIMKNQEEEGVVDSNASYLHDSRFYYLFFFVLATFYIFVSYILSSSRATVDEAIRANKLSHRNVEKVAKD